ncbi:collagen alpha-1(I) chain-like isoform X2 [Pan paniscus]|uniref:collagen alpha-1(I) chain-like isoform X2 n=1 Tax=Pan paniscus TaxID=9597 RepID=UPI002436E908|nr:collagen alpha-1(I) chain-like isoform X1 [Pan paniscus]
MSWRSGYSRPAAGTARRGPPLSPPGPRLVAGPPRARPSVPGLLAQSPPRCVSPQLRRLGHCSWLLAELWKPPRLNAAPADVTAACDQSAPRGPSLNHSASPGPGECGETAFRGSVAAAPAAPRGADGGQHRAWAPSCSEHSRKVDSGGFLMGAGRPEARRRRGGRSGPGSASGEELQPWRESCEKTVIRRHLLRTKTND